VRWPTGSVVRKTAVAAGFPGKTTLSKAIEKTYDGIIIGAGHHGLILGTYLARAGLKILLVDRRLTYGGGLCTREVTLPGFYHNLHSINHFHISETPWFKDLDLDERVTYITPRYEFGQAHHDGSALVLGRDLEESVANIARFSKKDAATFREWNRKAEKITAQIFLPERYAEPLSQAERESLLSRTALGREFLEVSNRPAARCRARVVRERACPFAFPVQGLAVRHLAGGHVVKGLAHGLGHSRL
jgi:phytoene dehydrogenase-like protein